MTCPNWRQLSARHDHQPEAWDRALIHLDDCGQCLDEALAVEPTLLFRRLPAPEVGSDDIAAMRRAVATLRRSERTVTHSRRSVGSRFTALRAAALGAILITAALLQGVVPGEVRPSATLPAASSEAARMVQATIFDRMPLVEDLDPAFGSAVQVVEDGLSLVLVLPPSDV